MPGGCEVGVLLVPRRALPRCFLLLCQPEPPVFPAVVELLGGGGCRPPRPRAAAGSRGTHGSGCALACQRLPRSWRAAVLPLEPRIPVASQAVIWLSPDYRAAKALINTSLICLKEPVYCNPIKGT